MSDALGLDAARAEMGRILAQVSDHEYERLGLATEVARELGCDVAAMAGMSAVDMLRRTVDAVEARRQSEIDRITAERDAARAEVERLKTAMRRARTAAGRASEEADLAVDYLSQALGVVDRP